MVCHSRTEMATVVDLSTASEAFGLPALLREDAMDLARVPMAPDRARDFETLDAFAGGRGGICDASPRLLETAEVVELDKAGKTVA